MREIKFRAWDKEFKKFSPRALNYSIKDINDSSDYEWSQYTGLQDIEGNDIYEGDILLRELTDRKTGIVFNKAWQKVIFEDGKFQGEWYKELKIFSKYEQAFYDKHTLDLETFNYQFKIIGNIYENPELIKE